MAPYDLSLSNRLGVADIYREAACTYQCPVKKNVLLTGASPLRSTKGGTFVRAFLFFSSGSCLASFSEHSIKELLLLSGICQGCAGWGWASSSSLHCCTWKYAQDKGHLALQVTFDERETKHRVIIGEDYYTPLGLSSEAVIERVFAFLLMKKIPRHTEGAITPCHPSPGVCIHAATNIRARPGLETTANLLEGYFGVHRAPSVTFSGCQDAPEPAQCRVEAFIQSLPSRLCIDTIGTSAQNKLSTEK